MVRLDAICHIFTKKTTNICLFCELFLPHIAWYNVDTTKGGHPEEKEQETLKKLLESRYGDLKNPQGCYVNGAWLSVEAVADLIDRVDGME